MKHHPKRKAGRTQEKTLSVLKTPVHSMQPHTDLEGNKMHRVPTTHYPACFPWTLAKPRAATGPILL